MVFSVLTTVTTVGAVLGYNIVVCRNVDIVLNCTCNYIIILAAVVLNTNASDSVIITIAVVVTVTIAVIVNAFYQSVSKHIDVQRKREIK